METNASAYDTIFCNGLGSPKCYPGNKKNPQYVTRFTELVISLNLSKPNQLKNTRDKLQEFVILSLANWRSDVYKELKLEDNTNESNELM